MRERPGTSGTPVMDAIHIVGAFEHPARKAPDKTIAQLHAESAAGALADAGLSASDVDGYFVATDAPGVLGGLTMAEYIGLTGITHLDSTETGGSAPLVMALHAAAAIREGKCRVALITTAGKAGPVPGAAPRNPQWGAPEYSFEEPYGMVTLAAYAMAAQRHMHEFGTSREQLSWVKFSAAQHALHNPGSVLRDPVTLEEVAASPMVADPLRRLDCCMNTDGGGAIVLTDAATAAALSRKSVRIRGGAEAIKHQAGGYASFAETAAVQSGPRAFAASRITPADIKYASIYDSFTITLIMTLEDLGFCEKGLGGRFVSDGNIIAGTGRLPINTDGGSLCNNHPGGRGGLPRLVEAVRQLRGEANLAVQVPNCDLALVHGTGGFITTRSSGCTLILEQAQ